MELQNNITLDNIETLVGLFYEKAMLNKDIGDFFILELGDDLTNEDWIEHIGRLVDFWGTIFLEEELYTSDPYGPHFTIIGLEEKHFKQWMKLFNETADEIYVPHTAKKFKDEGLHYSKDFMRRLNEDCKEEDLKRLKSKIGWE
ncbi:MAG TPA: group III truncated hemoglobin [Sulfurovum sp.]|nr:group III truncated hemoglobin [Sulfurovum sp.]